MKMAGRLAALLIAFALSGTMVEAQIINTLIGFNEDEPGFSGSGRALVGASGGNSEYLSLVGGGRFQWQNAEQRLRLILDGKRKSSGEDRIEEAVSGHIRHNHRILPWLHSLAFAQGQQNLFQRLRERFLIGLGGRVTLLDDGTTRIATGVSPMLEFERISGETGFDRDLRLSSFLLIGGSLNDHVELTMISFIQPLWNRLSDARAIATVAVESRIIGPLSLICSADFHYDSEPPEKVETTDWSLETGLAVTF